MCSRVDDSRSCRVQSHGRAIEEERESKAVVVVGRSGRRGGRRCKAMRLGRGQVLYEWKPAICSVDRTHEMMAEA